MYVEHILFALLFQLADCEFVIFNTFAQLHLYLYLEINNESFTMFSSFFALKTV